MTDLDAHLAASLSSRFRLIRQLGAGGMGAVFLAEQIAVGKRPVALKVLSRKLLDDPDFLLRFQNEAASTGRIHHPNVVTIYESGQADDGTPYIAMEFLEGESLRQALTRRGALPVNEVAEILQQAARALNAAHKLGIIHRDLKPDNIFLTYPDDEPVAPASPPAQTVAPASPPAQTVAPASPPAQAVAPASPPAQVEGALAPTSPPANVQVKIVDFGIAKLRESGAHTQTGTVLGTPAYMSYEQASGMRSDELDSRSDVYSLGVVVYGMLTGRTPFHSDTPVGYLRMHMQEDPPPFRTVKPDLPALPQLESVVMKALTKDRNQRYSSALEFAKEFAQAAEAPVPPPSTRVVSPPAAPKPPKLRMTPQSPRKMKFAAIAGVALMAILAGIWYFSQSPEKNPNSDGSIKKGDVSWSGKAGQSKGEVRINPNDRLKYVWIPPGAFMMGCSPGDNECQGNEKPAHQVTITKGFWLGQTEVTVGAYKRFVAATGRQMPDAPSFNSGWANDNMPIVIVNWDDAHDFCTWAGGRLATEAEWEYAARGGSTEARYGTLDEVAWYGANSEIQAHLVGEKLRNGFGLYDMLGNVEEWVNDWYDQNYYRNSLSQDPSGPPSGTERVLRGGSWYDGSGLVRVSFRSYIDPGYRGSLDTGFRCGGDVAGQKVAVSQSPTAASRQPPKPASQPADTKAQLAEKHFLKGYARFSNNDLSGAITEYREAIQLKPDFADAHYELGVALGEKGDWDGAVAEYREAIRLKPNDAGTHYDLALALEEKLDLDGAIAEYREAIRLKPDYWKAHWGLGENLGSKGDWDGEITEEREAIRLNPDSASVHNSLGNALERKGELQPALEQYRKAYELAPKDSTIRDNYEKLLKRLNPQQ